MKKQQKSFIYTFIILLLVSISFLFFELSENYIDNINKLKQFFSPYIFNTFDIEQSIESKYAPNNGNIGLWYGLGDTSDNNSDYYIVHNNTFYGNRVLKANKGDIFIIKGQKYKIYDIMNFKHGETLDKIAEFALPSMFVKDENKKIETACIQVCINNKTNRLVVAEAVD